MKPLWTDRDRSPSEPNFTDYTYVYFQGHKIGEIKDCISYSLTPYLNEAEIDDIDHICTFTIINQYKEYDQKCIEIVDECGRYYNMHNEIIQLGLKAKIQQLGELYANETKKMATVV